jgi:hypothetical protein
MLLLIARESEVTRDKSYYFFILYSGGHIWWTYHCSNGDCRLYILQLWTCHYTTVCIIYGKSDLWEAYLHKLMSCLCPLNEVAFLWRVAYLYWPLIHHRCVFDVNLCPLVFIDTHRTVTSWSSLEACPRSDSYYFL